MKWQLNALQARVHEIRKKDSRKNQTRTQTRDIMNNNLLSWTSGSLKIPRLQRVVVFRKCLIDFQLPCHFPPFTVHEPNKFRVVLRCLLTSLLTGKHLLSVRALHRLQTTRR